MAHRNYESLVDEEEDLAQLDRFDRVHVAGRLQNHEQGVFIHVQLGPLVRDDGVLHGQWVEIELLGYGLELLFGRLV